MSLITDAHFGGNIILTRDSLNEGQPFAETLKEIVFSGFRYPGGGVTEDQTWANGGLDRMFGEPIEPGSENYVLTIHEALDFSAMSGKPMTLVVPTFQFYDKESGAFDHLRFDRYVDKLETAIKTHPGAQIKALEIGNEYWGSKAWGSLTGFEYGTIANTEIPVLNDMIERLSNDLPSWTAPNIGIQAGVQWQAEQGPDGKWTAVGPQESADIISNISLEHRGMISTIFQHSYPDADTITQNLNWAIRPMEVFENSEGFASDLNFTFSEFNIGANTAVGIDQGAAWIEAFSKAVGLGVDSIDHWGISYDWLSNKFYDTKFPPAESDGGKIVTIATPMGQVYDIAQSHLVGKTTMTDVEAVQNIKATEGLGVTGFEDDGQQIVFLHNPTAETERVDLAGIPEEMHMSVRILKPADAPHSSWFDESARAVTKTDDIADARGDMKVVSGDGVEDHYDLQPGEMLVVVVSEPGRDLLIEGAHNVTDPGTGMVDDLIVGGQGDDILRGHVGNDTIEGGGGRNVTSGGTGDDRLVASDKGDVIFADGGDDTVVGGEGDDLIFSGGADDQGSSVIEGGAGRDIFLIGGGSNASIEDLSNQDYIGLGGAFADRGALREAAEVVGEDITISMPDGSQVLLVGQAAQIDTFHGQVLDFMEQEQITEITNSYLSELTYDQIVEIFHQKEQFEQSSPGVEMPYFDELEETIALLDIEQPDQEVPHARSPTGGHVDDNLDYPTVPSLEDDPQEHEPDDAYADQDPTDASGGSCFIATAAYGDPRHPDVVALRAFRDNHLVKTFVGRTFVRLYWIVGPKLAARTRPEQVHAQLARYTLSKTVGILRLFRRTYGK